MKVLLLNGSPRQGNTLTALKALKKGMTQIKDLEIMEINTTDIAIAPCRACDSCLSNENRCVHRDDTNAVISKVKSAELIVFATPVYWWGITAQMKLVIDKFYSQGEHLHKPKKAGVIVIGEAEQEDPQYQMIPKQFKCICGYLGWDLRFCKTYTAAAPDDLAKNQDAVSEIGNLWKTII